MEGGGGGSAPRRTTSISYSAKVCNITKFKKNSDSEESKILKIGYKKIHFFYSHLGQIQTCHGNQNFKDKYIERKKFLIVKEIKVLIRSIESNG